MTLPAKRRKTVKTTKQLVGSGVDIRTIIKSHSLPSIRRETKYRAVPAKAHLGKTLILGAAGSEIEIAKPYLKVMTDPYTHSVRVKLNMMVYTDPVLSPAFERRHDAFFEDGFSLTFELTSMYDPVTGKELSPDEVQTALTTHEQAFLTHLQKIREWSDRVDMGAHMATANVTSLVQGRAATIIVPGFRELKQNEMPVAIEAINWSDLDEPIVDVGLTHKVVGLVTEFKNKPMVTSDEMVYICRKDWGLRKESSKYGSSILEAVVTISDAIKHIYNYDIPEAVLASYVTKLIFRFASLPGLSDDDIKKVQDNFLNEYYTKGKLAFAVSNGVESVEPVTNKVDSAMMDINEKKLADVIMSIVGVPKSMLNREHNLNRDIATIEMIQFMKFVRKPDEEAIATAFEQQLLNPLLAHLANKPLKEIPIRIKIKSKSKEPDYSILEQKTEDAEKPQIAGASGGSWHVTQRGDEYDVSRSPAGR